jgi:ribosomal protein L32
MPDRPQKITFADMRDMGVRGLLIYCSDYKCSHRITMSGDRWLRDLRLSGIEPHVVCSACGKRGADVRPDFRWDWQQCR